MTPEQLADEVEAFIKAARERVLTDGARQYYDPKTQTQLFQTMPAPRLFTYAREELEDLAVYALMCWVRLRSLEAQIETGLSVEIEAVTARWMARNLKLTETGGLEPTEESGIRMVQIDGRWAITVNGEEVVYEKDVTPEEN